MAEQTNDNDDCAPIHCEYCETELEADDSTYRVLYGRLTHVRDGVISEKLVAGPGEEIDPGADERYYCLNCYKREHDRAKGAHFTYESADELFDILAASNGRLVADARPMTVGGRGWFRVVDGEVQARHSVMIRGDEDDEYDIKFETEPSPDFDRDEFDEFFDGAKEIRLVYLKSVDETPFVAGMNRTLGADYTS